MTLTDEQIAHFQSLYAQRFGKELDRVEALKSGIKLIRLMQLIYKPMTRNEYIQLQRRRAQTTH